MQMSALFGAKKLRIFLNLWCVCMDKGGYASEDILQTRGVNFLQFCVDVFYGQPLTIEQIHNFAI